MLIKSHMVFFLPFHAVETFLWRVYCYRTKEKENKAGKSPPLHGPEALIGWFKMDRMFRIPLVADFAADHSLKLTWRTRTSLTLGQ